VKHLEPLWKSAGFLDSHASNLAALVGSAFVWVQPHHRMLNICNLRTMATSSLQGDARESIINVALSEELVAFATSLNTCYVTDLAGANRKKFKLVRSMFQQLACRGHVVACGGFVNNCAMIYIWDYETQVGKSFEISLQAPPFSSRISS
jgi:hypothetical protein